MKEIELPVPPGLTSERIEAAILESGLIITMRGTLRQYLGCAHWHIKKPSAKGILELTWWPERNRLWFKIATNREAAWMESEIMQLTNRIAM